MSTEPERFRRCLMHVLVHEGGWSDHPSDPGGATMKGVTQKVYDAYRDVEGKPRRTVHDIETDELEAIYREGYWLKAGCDGLPSGVDYMVFDTAVNMGVSRAVKYLQTVLGVKADGVVGKVTQAAARRVNARVLVNHIFAQRKAFYVASPNYPVFGKGWLKRLRDVGAQAEIWATTP